MVEIKKTLICGILFTALICCPAIVRADIYRYRDENGVWHYTNIKTDKRYRLFIKSYKKSGKEYIRHYRSIIEQAARMFNVDPHLIRAVIKAESDFNHRAISRKGAKGLMQLMPKTAKDMRVSNPFNPSENIIGGTRYLAMLLKKFDNDKVLALAAYNAGPDKVEQYGGVPPFPETRGFIMKVLKYYREFKYSKR